MFHVKLDPCESIFYHQKMNSLQQPHQCRRSAGLNLLDRGGGLLVGSERLVVGGLVYLGSKGVIGFPLGGVAGSCSGHTHVCLFEGQTLELVDQEVGEKGAQDAKRTPEEEHLSSKVGLIFVDQVGCDDSCLILG